MPDERPTDPAAVQPAVTTDATPSADAAGDSLGTPAPEAAPAAVGSPAVAPADSDQTSLAAPAPAPAPAPVVSRALDYGVDIVFCIDVTGSMTPILDAVKANALRFYEDVQTNLTAKGKIVDELRVRVVAFRDLVADGEAALQE